jgi:hypothetical protein
MPALSKWFLPENKVFSEILWWKRRVSNPRPKPNPKEFLRVYPVI